MMKHPELLESVYELLEKNDMNTLKTLLQSIDDLGILELVRDLSSKELVTVYRLLNKDTALFVFENIDTSFQLKLIQSFSEEQSNILIAQLDADDRVRLLDELPAGVVKRMIGSLSKEQKDLTTLLMGYDPQTAGRIMNPEYIRLDRKITVKEAINKIRKQANQINYVYTLYITDDNRKLEGLITLKDLILANETDIIENLMTTSATKVCTDTDQEEAATIMQELNLLDIPVVDKQDLLVGIITIDDAMDVLEQEATEDILDKAGLANIASLENSRSEILVNGSFFNIWRVRIPFLTISLFGGLGAALIMSGFEHTLNSVLAVAFFIPVVMDMGGDIGTQSSTVFSRGFLLGHIRMNKFKKHLFREVLVGLTLGIIMGAAAATVAILWQNDFRLALAVGLSLMTVATFASFVGFVIPFVLFKLNFDQGAGKDPIITTIKDITGLAIYFTFVTLILNI